VCRLSSVRSFRAMKRDREKPVDYAGTSGPLISLRFQFVLFRDCIGLDTEWYAYFKHFKHTIPSESVGRPMFSALLCLWKSQGNS